MLKDYQDGTNLAFSPISIYLDLGLGARASAGNTQEQILNALNVDFETLNSSYKTLFCLLNDEYDEGCGGAYGLAYGVAEPERLAAKHGGQH